MIWMKSLQRLVNDGNEIQTTLFISNRTVLIKKNGRRAFVLLTVFRRPVSRNADAICHERHHLEHPFGLIMPVGVYVHVYYM